MVIVEAAHALWCQSRVAGALGVLGFEAGDRLGLCVDSSEPLLHVIGGAIRTGVVPVVVNVQLVRAERKLIRADADVRLWIDAQAELERLLDGPPAELAPFPLVRPMHYTSGTTGRPKGVWSGVLSDHDAERLWTEDIDQWQLGADDVHLVCSPLQHSAPIRFALSTLLVGGTVLLPGPFTVDRALAAVAECRPTTTFCSPAHLQRLDELGHLDAFSAFRFVAHAGAPCPERLKRRAIDGIGADRLWEFYGSTEGQFTVCSSEEWMERPGTVGRARAGRSLEIDADDTVWCHVPPWARWSYWGDSERTAAAWRGDAFTVGDLGCLDEAGYLFLTGRRSDLIISGGVNVYPVEVELALLEMPGIDEVVVFPRADERWGQRVCAAVVGDASRADVARFAAEHLAPFKRPKEIHTVSAIPRFGLAKVRRDRMASDLGLEPPVERLAPGRSAD